MNSASSNLIPVTVMIHRGDYRDPVTVIGEKVTDHFAVTPVAIVADDGAVTLEPRTALTHIPTGLCITADSFWVDQRRLAAALEALPIDWATLTKPTPEEAAQCAEVFKAHRSGDNDSGWPWPSWAGDESTPALSVLAGQLDAALQKPSMWDRAHDIEAQVKEHLPEDLFRTLRAYLSVTSAVSTVAEYGLIYALAVLYRVDPDAADRAARDLVTAWDAGDTMGEWEWQWRDELGKGLPLTLAGFPDNGLTADSGVSADLLRRAAAVLRERAEAATPGPWGDSAEGARYGALVSADTSGTWDEGYGGRLVGETMRQSDRSYAAAVHPGVGLVLADWLDFVAADINPGDDTEPDHALAVARQIVGESL